MVLTERTEMPVNLAVSDAEKSMEYAFSKRRHRASLILEFLE